MLPDLVHFQKDLEALSKLTSCNVISLYPSPSKEFRMKSSDATDLHQHKARIFLAEDDFQLGYIRSIV